MIHEIDINLLSKKSLCEQIEELSEGRMYLKNSSKWENQRKKNWERFYSGKINSKEYARISRILISNILDEIDTVYITPDEELPF